MTWAKYGTEFFDQLVDADFHPDLDDAAQLTHTQALHYLYSVESLDMMFKKSVLRRFATSSKAVEAAEELVRTGLWADRESHYEVLHHQDVFRQSLGYQLRERGRSKVAKRRGREKGAASENAEGTEDVPRDGTRDVPRDGMRTQTVSQSYSDEKNPSEKNDVVGPSTLSKLGPQDLGEILKEGLKNLPEDFLEPHDGNGPPPF